MKQGDDGSVRLKVDCVWGILFTRDQWSNMGRCMYWQMQLTINAMSDLVKLRYCSLLTIFRYFVPSTRGEPDSNDISIEEAKGVAIGLAHPYKLERDQRCTYVGLRKVHEVNELLQHPRSSVLGQGPWEQKWSLKHEQGCDWPECCCLWCWGHQHRLINREESPFLWRVNRDELFLEPQKPWVKRKQVLLWNQACGTCVTPYRDFLTSYL